MTEGTGYAIAISLAHHVHIHSRTAAAPAVRHPAICARFTTSRTGPGGLINIDTPPSPARILALLDQGWTTRKAAHRRHPVDPTTTAAPAVHGHQRLSPSGNSSTRVTKPRLSGMHTSPVTVTVGELQVADTAEAWSQADSMSTPMRSAASAASASASSDVSAEPGSCRGPCMRPAGRLGRRPRRASRPRHGTATPPRRGAPNGVIAIDHLMLLSPDLGRTVKSLAAIGAAAQGTRRRARRTAHPPGVLPPRRVIIEVVGSSTTRAEGPSNLWGITCVVADIDATATFLGEHTTPVKDAVQPGRRITTLHHREFDMSVRTALIRRRPPLTRVAPRARLRSEYPRPMPDSSAAPVVIHTDGGCLPIPARRLGRGALRHREHVREMCGGEAETTSNNRMELTVPIMALEALTRPVSVHLYTDSTYVRSGITGRVVGWERNGWLTTAAKQPVKNVDLWQRPTARLRAPPGPVVLGEGHPGSPTTNSPTNWRPVDYRRRWDARALSMPQTGTSRTTSAGCLSAAAPPTRVAQPAVGGPLAVAHHRPARGAHSRHPGVRAGKPCFERRFVGAQWREQIFQPGEILLREAGAHPAGEPQTGLGGASRPTTRRSAGASAVAGTPAADHDFLRSSSCPDPNHRAAAGLVGGVPPLATTPSHFFLAGVLQRLRPSPRGHDEIGSLREGFQHAAAIRYGSPAAASVRPARECRRPRTRFCWRETGSASHRSSARRHRQARRPRRRGITACSARSGRQRPQIAGSPVSVPPTAGVQAKLPWSTSSSNR